MKMNKLNKALSFVLCLVLVAAIALTTAGCGDKATDSNAESQTSTVSEAKATVLGSGSKTITLKVVNLDKTTSNYKISTDKDTLGEALLEVNLIEGSGEGASFYVTTVNGVMLDYNKDGKYWALYVGDSYGSTGVMSTKISDGSSYAFKAE